MIQKINLIPHLLSYYLRSIVHIVDKIYNAINIGTYILKYQEKSLKKCFSKSIVCAILVYYKICITLLIHIFPPLIPYQSLRR